MNCNLFRALLGLCVSALLALTDRELWLDVILVLVDCVGSGIMLLLLILLFFACFLGVTLEEEGAPVSVLLVLLSVCLGLKVDIALITLLDST